jgi:hypothetical protein
LFYVFLGVDYLELFNTLFLFNINSVRASVKFEGVRVWLLPAWLGAVSSSELFYS